MIAYIQVMINHKTHLFTTLAMLALLLISCADDEAVIELQEGMASWYGPGFHGQRTSSGEIYDANDTTAAHRTLPFDTIVRVVNTDNDSTVYVRINDRGPYVGERIIDLSRYAAEQLDMLEEGTARVRLELVEAGGPIPDDLNREQFTIQLAEYSGPLYANRFAEDAIEEIGDGVRVEQVYMFQRTRYMVYYGQYESIGSARQDLNRLKEMGYKGFVKQIN